MTDRNSSSQIVVGLLRIAAFARSHQWQSSEQLGLTPTQITILRVLADRGAMRISNVGKSLGVTQATASDAIAALEAKGLIARKPDPQDARARLAALTEQGADTAARHHEAPEELLNAFDQMSEIERAHLLRGLSMAVRHLQEKEVIQPQRLCISCKYFQPNVHGRGAKPHHCDFVNAAFSNGQLRLDCSDHETAEKSVQFSTFRRFLEELSA